MSSSGGPAKSAKQAYVFSAASANTGAAKRNTDAQDVGNEGSNKKIRIDICTTPAWNAAQAAAAVAAATAASGGSGVINKVGTKSQRCMELNPNAIIHHNVSKETTTSMSHGTNNEDIVIIRNINSQDLSEAVSAGPIESVDEVSTDNYVVFSSDVIVDGEDYVVKPSNRSTTSSHNVEITNTKTMESKLGRITDTVVSTHKTITSSNSMVASGTVVGASIETTEQAHVISSASADTPSNTGDEIEVVLLPSLSETSKKATIESLISSSGSSTIKTNTSAALTRIASVSSNGQLLCQSPVSSAGGGSIPNLGSISSNVSGLQSATTAVLSRMNVQSALKNQPLMVTSKKLMSEVMQTTAKVSIGNTTISVPLLKSVNPKQLIQTNSGYVSSELQKSQAQTATFSTQTTLQSQAAQTQLNLSKILNVKRGQKSNQPTIVSLSQLQIKPAKIVQAKVLGKKMQMPLQLQPVVTTATLGVNQVNKGTTSGIVTICGGAKHPHAQQQQKQQLVHNFAAKMPQLTVVHETVTMSNANCKSLEDETSTLLENDKGVVTERLDNVLEPSASAMIQNADKKVSITSKSIEIDDNIAGAALTVTTTPNNATTTIKKLFPTVSVSNVPPLLPTLTKYTTGEQHSFKTAAALSQPHTINMNSAISIIKQTTPQLVTTSTLLNSVSSNNSSSPNVVISEAGIPCKTPTLSLNSTGGAKLNSALLPLSRNISLRLTKNNIGVATAQTTKPSALTITSSGAPSGGIVSSTAAEFLPKKLNLPIPNTLNITEVHVSRASELPLKSSGGIISLGLQTHEVANSTTTLVSNQEHAVDSGTSTATMTPQQHKTIRLAVATTSVSSSFSSQVMKRSKSVDCNNDHDANATKKLNLEVTAIKRDTSEVRQNFMPIVENELTVKSLNVDDLQPTRPLECKKGPTIATNVTQITKSEESNNVLLKQLLQNSSSASTHVHNTPVSTQQTVSITDSSATTPIGNQPLSALKVINLRAPCLGTVSSLEAQLARPVIPPVPATATATAVAASSAAAVSTPSHAQDSNVMGSKLHISSSNNEQQQQQQQQKSSDANVIGTTVQKDIKLKPSVVSQAQIISKETSFVSNPNINVTSSEMNSYRYSSIVPISTTIQHIAQPTEESTQTSSTSAIAPPASSGNINRQNKSVEFPRVTNSFETLEEGKERKSAFVSTTTNVVTDSPNITYSNSNTNATTITTVINSGEKMMHIKPGEESIPANTMQTLEENNTKLSVKVSRTPKLVGALNTSHPALKIEDVKHSNEAQMYNQQSILLNSKAQSKKQDPIPSAVTNNVVEVFNNTRPPDALSETQNTHLSSMPGAGSQSEKVIIRKETGTGKSKLPNSAEKIAQAAKDAEFRKKRKREYQKQRRQLHNANKESSTNIAVPFSVSPNTANAKRRPRKFSKVEEDHDNFIENLITRIRQMQPLQVQEPLLSRNFGIYNSYGRQSADRLNASSSNNTNNSNNNSKETENQSRNQLQGEYGRARHWNMPALYENDNFKKEPEERNKNAMYTIQNDFYDQEFLPVICKNEYDKQIRFIGLIRERNMEVLETVSRICNGAENNHLASSQISYPGLVLMNNESSQYLGRMSPIIPPVKPGQQKIKFFIKPTAVREEGNLKIEIKQELGKSTSLTEYKMSKKEDGDVGNQTVILSLPPSSSNNILGILKDLANLLHIATPTNYKIIEAPNLSTVQQYRFCMQDRQSARSRQHVNLQKLINGRRKMCRNCGKPITGIGVRAFRSSFPDIKTMLKLKQQTSLNFNFCNKSCCDQFKLQSKNLSLSLLNKIKKAAPQPTFSSTNNDVKSALSSLGKEVKPSSTDVEEKKKCGFKYFSGDCFKSALQFKRLSEKELSDILFKMNITVSAINFVGNAREKNSLRRFEDIRQCILCNQRGDGLSDGPSRLLNFEVDKWVHLNCALWSNGVYETISGGLMNLQAALQVGLSQTCSGCQHLGATVKCFKNRCSTTYHLSCAIKKQCVFYKNKTIHCQQHASRSEKDNELSTLTVHRRVYVERDENRQVATIMHHSELTNLLRVGGLTFLNVGQLLPHQLDAFHTVNYIYPIGYKIIRFYWSMKKPNKRCRYICSIAEVVGRPEFRIQVQESSECDVELRDSSPNAVWKKILEPISALRKDCELVTLFPQFITGEDLFGLTEPAIVRIIESLPGIETLTDYRFKYGRNPLLELPLAINPSGSARTEPKQRQLLGWRKPHTQRTANIFNQRTVNSTTSVVAGEVACPYSKQFVHSKSSQYKKMKQEWRNNVYLARSKIQGLGLYAARDIEKHTMIIEYIGEVIRTEVSEIREKQYESKNRGIYMFRLDEDRVVDATLSGGLARYINHSCNPNCVTEIVEVDREVRIIIFAKRRINRGEELSYDYKFDIEDDANKIPCMCGAPNCRKWMN